MTNYSVHMYKYVSYHMYEKYSVFSCLNISIYWCRTNEMKVENGIARTIEEK